MSWKKLGRIFSADSHSSLLHSHVQNPQAIPLQGTTFRIFFSSRDSNNRSSIFYLDIDILDPLNPIFVNLEPVISFGSAGHFDDSGVTHGHIVNFEGKFYLYYVGWNLGVTVPWRNSIGLATSDSLDSIFKKMSPAPILDRSHVDPFSLSYPFVSPNSAQWSMIYGSNLSWGKEKSEMRHVLKRAVSQNGINWIPTGEIELELSSHSEIGIARPWVCQLDSKEKMLFGYRNESYRIGSAERNADGKWLRVASDEIQTSNGSIWDSQMLCYPSVFSYENRTFLLYCGNSFGKTGFGIAEWV